MPTYGLTDDGLVIPTLAEIRESLEQALRDTFGESLQLGDKSIFGQIIGIIAERLAALWQQLEAVNSSQNPDKATLAALDALCTLTGTFRPAASFSSATLTLTGVPATLVSAGSKAATTSTAKNFVTLVNATIVATVAWTPTTVYAVGARVTNVGNVYICSTAGTSAGSGGPVQIDRVPISIADGTTAWIWVGKGTGDVDVIARAEETGPTVAVAYDIAEIETAVTGWDGVVNLLDATEGRDEARDGELRVLREQELATGGNATINALRAEILQLADVIAATVFVNNTDTTDADGLPPHSVEVLVRGGLNQDIWDALLDGVAAGIKTHGTEDGTSADDQGTTHAMSFTRPTDKNIYATLTVTYDADLYPSDGDAQIEAAIVAFGDLQDTGKNVVASSLVAQAFLISGVLDASALISVFPVTVPVASTTIQISLRELAIFDTSRISITSTPGVP